MRATSAATQAHARVSSARIGVSFGTPQPPGAPGARLSLSNGAAGALILGLVIADVLHYLASPGDAGRALPESISHTCSCYGYDPGVRSASASASE